MTANLFQNVATLARQQALTGLEARAERDGLIISICSGCYAYLGEQDGRGVTGLSHGLCPVCLEGFSAGIASSEGGLREGAEQGHSVPSHFSEGQL